MENFYKITKAQASTLGKIMYAKNHQFDPFVSEQKDGTYLVSEKMVLLLKTTLSKVDFTKRPKITKEQIDAKDTTPVIEPKKG